MAQIKRLLTALVTAGRPRRDRLTQFEIVAIDAYGAHAGAGSAPIQWLIKPHGVPKVSRSQRLFRPPGWKICVPRGSDAPSRRKNLKLIASAAAPLTAGGYVYIGMDQFALPGDSLAVAQREGRLNWSCPGYTTHAHCDLVGLGTSAIGAIGPTYSENAGAISDYYARLDGNDLPIVRGIELTHDDLVRRNVIHRLMCHCEVSKEAVGVNYLLDFDHYFAAELEALHRLQHDGLVELEPDWICVTPRGRLLVPIICMVFDRYRRADHAGNNDPRKT
jgi:coproporphyrinogen III oxidase-like Fe-S oxidoreductase